MRRWSSSAGAPGCGPASLLLGLINVVFWVAVVWIAWIVVSSIWPGLAGVRIPNATSDEVRKAVVRGWDLDERNADGLTPLMRSVSTHRQDQEATRLLLAAGADVGARSEDGRTPLMFAVADGGNLEAVRLLVDAGADVNAVSNDGDPVLLIAAGGSHQGLVTLERSLQAARFAIVEGSEPTSTGFRDAFAQGLLAFSQSLASSLGAVLAVDPAVIKELIDAGAEINARDAKGMTALHIAATGVADAESVRVLLAAGADVAARDDLFALSPLEAAAAVNANLEVHRVLLSAERARSSGVEGGLPLVAAALNPNADVARFLIRAGFDPNTQTELGRPLLVAAALNPVASVTYTLLSAGADPNLDLVDEGLDHTPLMLAARFNPNAEVTRMLLAEGADVNASAADCTALHRAVEANRAAATRALLEHGADADAAGDDCEAPILLATLGDPSLDIVALLIDAGADVNARDGQGWTALMRAVASSRDTSVVELLLRSGADRSLDADDGTDALAVAEQRTRKRRDFVRLLGD